MTKSKRFLIVGAACALLFMRGPETDVVAQATGPYSGWFDADIGDVGQPGSSSQHDDTFYVKGAGSDIWGTADSFHFTYTRLDGDGDVYVKAASETATNPFAKAGVMIRQSLDPSSPHVVFDLKPEGGVELMTRPSSGAATTFVKGAQPGVGVFLRVTRRSGFVAAFISTECSMGCDNWSMFSDGWIPLPPGPALIGLAVTSHDPSTLNSATLDFWDEFALDAPWQQTDFYPESHVDSARTARYGSDASPLFILPAAGGDIWGTSDSFKFVWRQTSGDAAIIARVTGERYTDPFAKAGLMMRAGLTVSAPDVIIDSKPDGSIEFMSRSADGADTQYLAGGYMPFPAWLKLERQGNVFIGSESTDGNTWTVVGSTTVAMRASGYFAGLAATSHTSTYTPYGAAFDHVALSQLQAGNLLQKPGFEEYTTSALGAPGWVSDPFRATPAVAEGAEPHTGARNGACRSTENLDCGIFQDVTIPVSANYMFEIYAAADKPGGLVGVNINGTTYAAQQVAVGGYQRWAIGFLANAGDTVRVWMYSPNTPGAVVIDDASLTIYNGPR